MIRVKIFNGLGNQMFQYACGRAIQEKYNGDLCLDIADFEVNMRNYGLHNFKLNESIKIIEKDNTFSNFRKNWLLKILYRIAPKFMYFIQSKFGKYLYFGAEYIDIPKNFTNNYYLYGYWQSEKYFENIKSIIKQEFSLKNPLSVEQQKIITDMNNQNSVAVHIRRGDYLKDKLFKGLCDETYYRNAVKIMQEKINNPVFYVFSNEISWVKENWNFIDNAVFVDGNKDFEELEIMSHCKHFIIANSSFSWWAQYLSESIDKIVIAPKKWLNTNENVDIYMDEWIKV